MEAKTVSGDQRVDAVRQGRIKLQSVSGDVRLGVRPGTRLRIDATSVERRHQLRVRRQGQALGRAHRRGGEPAAQDRQRRRRARARGRGERLNAAAGRSLAESGLPLALVVADDQPVRLADQPARPAARRDRRARGERVRGRAPRRGRVPSLSPPVAAGRRLGRPAPPQADPDRLRPGACRRARLDTARLLARRTDDLAALRRRLRRRSRHRLLRRRVPVVSAVARCSIRADGGQLEAGGEPLRGAARRAGRRRRADRAADRAGRGRSRCDQLPRLRASPPAHPHRRGGTGGRGPAFAPRGAARGAQLCPPAPVHPRHGGIGRDLQLLRERRRRDRPRLRGARARPLGDDDRDRARARQRRLPRRRARREAGGVERSAWGGRSSARRRSSAPGAAAHPTRAEGAGRPVLHRLGVDRRLRRSSSTT